jgi:hypothetical protein
MKNIYEDLFFCFNFLIRARTYYYTAFMTIYVKQKLLVESDLIRSLGKPAVL